MEHNFFIAIRYGFSPQLNKTLWNTVLSLPRIDEKFPLILKEALLEVAKKIVEDKEKWLQ